MADPLDFFDRRCDVAFEPETAIPAAELRALLDRLAAGRKARKAPHLLRIDASRGLCARLSALLRLCADYPLSPCLAFPILRAGDLAYVREGGVQFDRQALQALAALQAETNLPLALLADPASVITRCQSPPGHVWSKAVAALAEAGIEIAGLVTSNRQSAADLYERLWVYRVRQKQALHLDVDFSRSFRCPEWNSPISPQKPGLSDLLAGLDWEGIGDVRLLGETPCRPVYSRRFAAALDSLPDLEVTPAAAVYLFTHAGRWFVHRSGRAEALSHGEVEALLASADPLDLRVVLDPRDIDCTGREGVPAPLPSPLRALPYPYDHFLAVNSDVDWSTYEQMEGQAREVCDRLGLVLSGSAYPFAAMPDWISWARCAGPKDAEGWRDGLDWRVLAWAAEGLIDTFHGTVDTMDAVSFEPDDAAEPDLLLASRQVPIRRYDGILLTCAAGSGSGRPRLWWVDQRGEIDLGAPDMSGDDRHAYFHFRDLLPVGDVRTGRLRVDWNGHAPALAPVTTRASRASLAGLLEALEAVNVRVPLMTAHGGGVGTRRFGVAMAERKGVQPGEDILPLDREGTPFHLAPLLRRFGTAFLNPVGWFGRKDLSGLDDLFQEFRTRDDRPAYLFRRFASRRFEEDGSARHWSHQKLTSSVQALAYNLDDLLQRLHWSPPGRGAIVYTHLGHRVGNQIADRLGWTEELMACWERVAELAHGRDGEDPASYRLWVTGASRLLAYAAVRRGLADHLTQEGRRIVIGSWRDEALDLDLPAVDSDGASWLHGITLYCDDPGQAVVEAGGRVMDFLVRNPKDRSGRASVTIVDGGDRIPCLHGKGSIIEGRCPPALAAADALPALRLKEDIDLAIHPVSLRNATHWSFRLRPGARIGRIAVGFRLMDGRAFFAGHDGWSGGDDGSDWAMAPEPDRPCRWTFCLTDGADGRSSVPTGAIDAVLIRLEASDEVLLEDISVIRPLPPGRRARRRILAGRCLDPFGRPAPACLTLSGHDQRLTTTVRPDGWWAFEGLIPDGRYGIEADRPVHFARGTSVLMTTDFWDWNLTAAP